MPIKGLHSRSSLAEVAAGLRQAGYKLDQQGQPTDHHFAAHVFAEITTARKLQILCDKLHAEAADHNKLGCLKAEHLLANMNGTGFFVRTPQRIGMLLAMCRKFQCVCHEQGSYAFRSAGIVYCPQCAKPVPANEAATYGGRHENCDTESYVHNHMGFLAQRHKPRVK